MSYDSQPVTSAPLQRPMMAPDFFPNMSSYRTAPIPTMAGPQYSPQMPFNNYHFGSSSSVTPFKQQHPDRPVPRIMPVGSNQSRESSYSHESQPCSVDGSRSPSIKSEVTSLASMKAETAMSASPERRAGASAPWDPMPPPRLRPRRSTPSLRLNEAAEAQFNTPIDTLMRDIQAKRKARGTRDEAVVLPKAEPEPKKQPKKVSISTMVRHYRHMTG